MYRDLAFMKHTAVDSEDEGEMVIPAMWAKRKEDSICTSKRFSLVTTIILLLSLALNCILLYATNFSTYNCTKLAAFTSSDTAQVSSPIREQVDMGFHLKEFNGSFFKPTIYRQDPSPQVDEVWEALGTEDMFIAVREEEAESYGLRKDYHAVLESDGSSYLAAVEGLHHLHCLNMIRQTVYFNYEYYSSRKLGPFQNDDWIVRAHTTHCIDTLRQRLMCEPDLNLFGQLWVNLEDGNAPIAWPDFNTGHQCRNFDEILQWVEKRKLPEHVKLLYYNSTFAHRGYP